MDLPAPADAVVAFASFVRQRLAEVSDTLNPLWSRRDAARLAGHGEGATGVHQFAMVIVGAAAPFAATAQARARLLRQAHASGLLTDREARALGAPDTVMLSER